MTQFGPFCERIGLHLEPFQRRIAKAVEGSERELVVLLPRGQGKTTLLAAVALHQLLTVNNAAVYAAASSREQARILYESAAHFARVLEDEHVVVRHLELRYCENPDEPNVFSRHLRVLAADAPRLHGLTPSLAIVDELHTHPDDEVYLALRTATLKRPDSRLIVISTAGQGADSPLGRLRARALAQPNVTRRGVFTDARGPALRMLEWSVPEEADIEDVREVKEANPASWITEAALHEQQEAVAEAAFRRYHCNQWTAKIGAWLPAGAWQACAGETSFEDGERIWVGVDVGGERADSAVVWVNENLHVGVETWSGDDAVLEVAAFVAELAEKYTIVEAVFDPWRAGQMAQEWEQRGIPAVAFPQSDSRMIPASERLYDAVTHQRLTPRRSRTERARPRRDRQTLTARLAPRQARPRLQNRRRRRARHGRRAAGLQARTRRGSGMDLNVGELESERAHLVIEPLADRHRHDGLVAHIPLVRTLDENPAARIPAFPVQQEIALPLDRSTLGGSDVLRPLLPGDDDLQGVIDGHSETLS